MYKQYTSLTFSLFFFILLPQMVSAHMWKHEYKLTNIKRLDIAELHNMQVVAIENIPRTHHVYVLTSTKQFFALNFKTGKVLVDYSLDFLDKPKDMKCTEGRCMILHESNRQKEIFEVDGFFSHLNTLRVKKWAIIDLPSVNNIVLNETNNHNNYSTQKLILMDKSNRLHSLTYKLNMPDIDFVRITNELKQGIYVDVVKKVAIKRHEGTYINRLQNLLAEYNTDTIEIDHDSFKTDILTCINDSEIIYASVDLTSEDTFQGNAIDPKATFTIKHNRKVKDVALHFKDNHIVDKVIFLSVRDHQLYTASLDATVAKKTSDTLDSVKSYIRGMIMFGKQ